MNLGIAFLDLGDFEKAKDVLERVVKMKERHYGQEHFVVAKALTNLATAYGELEDYDKAKNILERAVNINVKHYGHGSVEVAILLYNFGTDARVARRIPESVRDVAEFCCLCTKIILELTLIAAPR